MRNRVSICTLISWADLLGSNRGEGGIRWNEGKTLLRLASRMMAPDVRCQEWLETRLGSIGDIQNLGTIRGR